MKLYKYKPIELDYNDSRNVQLSEYTKKRLIGSILNDEIYFPKISQLNDPTEGIFKEKLTIEINQFLNGVTSMDERQNLSEPIFKNVSEVTKRIKESGVLSLSKTYKDELMWAHYANSHCGIVIEYDKDLLISNLEKESTICLDVEYEDFPPILGLTDLYSASIEKFANKYLRNKSKRWKYEEEFRIILKDNNGLIKYTNTAVKSITFGINVPNDIKNEIISMIISKVNNFYEMKIIYNSYEFDRIEKH